MFYNIIRVCIYPVIFLLCIFSGKKRKFFFRRFFQNLNFLDGNKEYIWIHCSSVGEINLSEGLIKKIKSIYLNKKILISTFTDTGYATGETILATSGVLISFETSSPFNINFSP